MCGILGVRRSWQPDRVVAERALRALAWRGPDGSALVAAGDFWLGVARLWITDRAAAQPIRCPATGSVIVCNGAVTSAAREWGAHGAGAATRNDAELALARLRAGGAAALTATCGPYALAIVDPRDDTLYLARDPEGEKPLLVVVERARRRVVAFASCAAALRALGLDVRLPPEEAARLLRYGFTLGPSLTHPDLELAGDLRGVFVQRAGEALAALPGQPAPEASSRADFGARVVAAVRRCASAEVPVGLCLSGGVDSSCLAAALAQLGQRLPAYQACACGESPAERMRAHAVAVHCGHELRPIDLRPECLRALPALTCATGMPQGDPSVLAAHALARAASADGVKVLLSGEGADDLWLGYRRHRAARWLPARGLRLLRAPAHGRGTLARLARALGAPCPYDALLEVAPPGFRRAVLRDLPPGDLPAAGEGQPALARARLADRTLYLRCDLLPKADVALLAAGIEGRLPYLDPELLAAPETQAPDPRRILGKRALKAAFAAHLPAGLLSQFKQGFALPLDRWLREDDFLADVLRDACTRQRAHVLADGLGQALDAHRAGRARLGHPLYLVAAYELYLRALEPAA